jgi:glycosyltransferase involved in cell wall biosynthesis
MLGTGVPLKIVGDGPLSDLVKAAVAGNSSIEWLGRKSMDEVYELIGAAACLVFPSNCYETFGRVAIEAFARGTPVIASNHGAMADVTAHGKTGLLFAPGDGADLAAKVRQMLSDESARRSMRGAARAEFEAKYTGARNYEQLMSVYERALSARARKTAHAVMPAGSAPA